MIETKCLKWTIQFETCISKLLKYQTVLALRSFFVYHDNLYLAYIRLDKGNVISFSFILFSGKINPFSSNRFEFVYL